MTRIHARMALCLLHTLKRMRLEIGRKRACEHICIYIRKKINEYAREMKRTTAAAKTKKTYNSQQAKNTLAHIHVHMDENHSSDSIK